MDSFAFSVLLPSLSLSLVGAVSGAVLAVHRAQSIPIYALSTGLNCAILSSTFFSLRTVALQAPALQTGSHSTTTQKVYASTISGLVTGGFYNALRRGKTGLVGVSLAYASFGGVSEFLVQEAFDLRRRYIAGRKHDHEKISVYERVINASPFRKIPDDEYREIMRQRITDLDGRIRLVDAEIEATKKLL